MKTWAVNIPCLVRDVSNDDERDDREYAMSVRFEIQAEKPDEAVYILWQRLEPTCGDP